MEPKHKFYTEKQIGISALISGPLPAGYMFFLNYKRLGKEREALITLFLTIVFTISLFVLVINLPDTIGDKLPNSLFTVAYGLIVFVIYRTLLSKEINQKIQEGSTKASNWNVARITFFGLLLTFGIIILLALTSPPFSGDKLQFGEAKHEVYFDPKVTSENDVNKVASQLETSGYFTGEIKNSVHLDTWNTRFILTIPFPKEYWEDPDVNYDINALKNNLSVILEKDITIVLEHYQLNGKRIEKRF